MNWSEQEKQDFEAQLEDTDTKAVLLGIHAELQAIRSLIDGAQADTDDAQERLTCELCGQKKPADGLVEHAIDEHNAPPDATVSDLARE